MAQRRRAAAQRRGVAALVGRQLTSCGRQRQRQRRRTAAGRDRHPLGSRPWSRGKSGKAKASDFIDPIGIVFCGKKATSGRIVRLIEEYVDGMKTDPDDRSQKLVTHSRCITTRRGVDGDCGACDRLHSGSPTKASQASCTAPARAASAQSALRTTMRWTPSDAAKRRSLPRSTSSPRMGFATPASRSRRRFGTTATGLPRSGWATRGAARNATARTWTLKATASPRTSRSTDVTPTKEHS